MSAASLGNGAAERPWKERVQSILSSVAFWTSRGWSESPLLEMLSVVVRLDARVGVRAAPAWEGWGVTVVVRGAWVGVGFAVLLCVVWGRVELELIARLVMGLDRRWTAIRM